MDKNLKKSCAHTVNLVGTVLLASDVKRVAINVHLGGRFFTYELNITEIDKATFEIRQEDAIKSGEDV